MKQALYTGAAIVRYRRTLEEQRQHACSQVTADSERGKYWTGVALGFARAIEILDQMLDISPPAPQGERS